MCSHPHPWSLTRISSLATVDFLSIHDDIEQYLDACGRSEPAYWNLALTLERMDAYLEEYEGGFEMGMGMPMEREMEREPWRRPDICRACDARYDSHGRIDHIIRTIITQYGSLEVLELEPLDIEFVERIQRRFIRLNPQDDIVVRPRQGQIIIPAIQPDIGVQQVRCDM